MDNLVDCPIDGLDLTPFVLNEDEGAVVYRLYAVVNHSGGYGGGHYFTYARGGDVSAPDKWHEYNDSHVEALDGPVVTRRAYMLLYERVDNATSDAVTGSGAAALLNGEASGSGGGKRKRVKKKKVGKAAGGDTSGGSAVSRTSDMDDDKKSETKSNNDNDDNDDVSKQQQTNSEIKRNINFSDFSDSDEEDRNDDNESNEQNVQEEKTAAKALARLTGETEPKNSATSKAVALAAQSTRMAAAGTQLVLGGTLRGTLGAMSHVGALTKSLATTLQMGRLPPPDQLEKAINNIFERARTACVDELSAARDVLPDFPRLKGAPPDTFSAFSLAQLRAVGLLWRQFVADCRWHWENGALLAGASLSDDSNVSIDLQQCLIQQKFAMLNYCIERKYGDAALNGNNSAGNSPRHTNAIDHEDDDDGGDDGGGDWDDFDIDVPSDESDNDGNDKTNNDNDNNDADDDDADATLGQLKRFDENLFVPITQDLGPATDDMLQEREDMLSRLGTDAAGTQLRTQLQTRGLSSDMQAFKAANPNCELIDFVRWHSPNDIINDELSERMKDESNVWHQLWRDATATKAKDQKSLFDVEKEANRALHYLESISPLDLMSQVMATILSSLPILFGWEAPVQCVEALKLPLIQSALKELCKVVKTIWYVDRTNAMTREELDQLTLILSNIEQLLSRATSLFAKFPNCHQLVEKLLIEGEAIVLDAQERKDVCAVFADIHTGSIPTKAQWVEFIIRTLHARPACDAHDARDVLHRTYALLGTHDLRLATCVALDDGM
eukprot:CAMPEP_0168588738 /NCGR_PEP_ID=MMETSP0420-20121227/5622_1 /TAXON_ID=498008 /ORGANISM="Pessonella sp." /LENGTH=782 /DNA_ID=CAMNT_0008624205 /DNA_START=529 /DNA_END=2877 /DNA_ORIENTATION=+